MVLFENMQLLIREQVHDMNKLLKLNDIMDYK